MVRYLYARGHHEDLDLADGAYALGGPAHPCLHLPPPRVIVVGHASLERDGEGDLRALLVADARYITRVSGYEFVRDNTGKGFNSKQIVFSINPPD